MENNDLIKLSEHIVKSSFALKFDKSGVTYDNHLRYVRSISLQILKYLKDHDLAKVDKQDVDECTITSYLHDLIEDCSQWNFSSINDLFGTRIMEYLLVLTKDSKKDTSYQNYLIRLCDSNLLIPMVIKLADLYHNMQYWRLRSIDEKDIERIKKYHKGFHYMIERISGITDISEGELKDIVIKMKEH